MAETASWTSRLGLRSRDIDLLVVELFIEVEGKFNKGSIVVFDRACLTVGAGFGVVLALLGCVAMMLFGIMSDPPPGPEDGRDVAAGNGTTYQWQLVPEMAVRLDPVYRPSHLPAGVDHPTIRVTTSGAREVMTATYAGGLVLRQTNSELGDIVSTMLLQPAALRSAEEAGFAQWRGVRSLLLRRGDAWIVVSAQSDSELVRVAESLQPIE